MIETSMRQSKVSTNNTTTEDSTEIPVTESETTESTSSPTEPDGNESTSEDDATGTDSDNCYEVVDSTLSDLCKSDKFIKATDDEKYNLPLSTLEELESRGLIMQGSVKNNGTDKSSIIFKYTNGGSGVFVTIYLKVVNWEYVLRINFDVVNP